MRMKGYNVLFPMGFDAFGLPAENAAIKDGIHPMKRTYQNIERMRKQMRIHGRDVRLGARSRLVPTRILQMDEWFFIQLYKAGLAYRKMSPVDWCPNCNTTLAREQVWGDDRRLRTLRHARHQKGLEQWFFKATKYADELLRFDEIDWPERVKTLQTNWIDRSEGAEVGSFQDGSWHSAIGTEDH
jgi:leucyl-tRNA synthetase